MKADDFSKEIAFGDDPKFDKWIRQNILNQFLFTHREKNGDRYGYCSACRRWVSFTKRTFTAEDIENEGKRHNQLGYCSECGEKVIFKDSGRPRTSCLSYDRFITYEITDSGLIMHFIAAQLDYREGKLELIVPQYFEEYRLYLNPVKNEARMWQRPIGYISYYNFQRYKVPTAPYIGQWFEMNKPTYRPKNYDGFKIYKGKEFYSQLKKVPGFEYIDELFTKSTDGRFVLAYLMTWTKHPEQSEMLSKTKYREIFKEYINNLFFPTNNYYGRLNWRGKTLYKIIGLTKSEDKEFESFLDPNRAFGSYSLAFFKAIAKDNELSFNMRKAIYEKLTFFSFTQLKEIASWLPVEEKEIFKYFLSDRKKSVGTWADYIRYAIALGWDMTDRHIVFPNELNKAHDRAMELDRAAQAANRKKAKSANNKAIAENFKKLNKYYYFERGDLFIRPAKSASEIVAEGKEQSICVGSDTMPYKKNHAAGIAYILFIRKKDEPDKPFYTVEISNKGYILQCRGYANCGKTKDVDDFVKAFQSFLQSKNLRKAV